MSSPLPSSQIVDTDHETPGTTPPAPPSLEATPQPDSVREAPVDASPEEEEETLSLPISKIKRIFKMDPDYMAASQSAVYATGVATELFIQYLVEQASLQAKIDRRKKINYKDLSNAVATQELLHFLADTVPKTLPIGELIQQKKVHTSEEQFAAGAEDVEMGEPDEVPEKKPLPKGQQTLGFVAEKPIKKAPLHDLMG